MLCSVMLYYNIIDSSILVSMFCSIPLYYVMFRPGAPLLVSVLWRLSSYPLVNTNSSNNNDSNTKSSNTNSNATNTNHTHNTNNDNSTSNTNDIYPLVSVLWHHTYPGQEPRSSVYLSFGTYPHILWLIHTCTRAMST